MWKKQWNKLKTAMGAPEEYIEEETTQVDVEEVEDYRTDPIINIQYEDILPVIEVMQAQETMKTQAGEMLLRHESERRTLLQYEHKIKEELNLRIVRLRTTYNVEPNTDYRMNLPSAEGEPGSFVRTDSTEES